MDAFSSLFNLPEFSGFSGQLAIEGPEIDPLVICRGETNRAEHWMITPDTRFGMASGSKIFTALAVCQLIEAAKARLDTPLRSILDCVPGEYDPGITLFHLLTHTSGIQDYADEEEGEVYEDLWIHRPMYRMREPKDFLPLLFERPWMKKPLGEFAYNNAGYVWLGLVIEALTGKAFGKVIQEQIFTPAGMADTGYYALDQLPGGTALGYIDEENGGWRTNQYAIPVVGGGDGGAFTTAEDMRRFWRAWAKGDLLGPQGLEQMKKAHARGGETVAYGLGVWQRLNTPQPCFYVLGEDPGVYLYSGFYAQSGVTCSIFCNASGFPFWKLTARVREILTGIL